MNQLLMLFLAKLCIASILLTVTSVVLWIAHRLLSCKSARLCSLSGWIPLIQGVMFFSLIIPISDSSRFASLFRLSNVNKNAVVANDAPRTFGLSVTPTILSNSIATEESPHIESASKSPHNASIGLEAFALLLLLIVWSSGIIWLVVRWIASYWNFLQRLDCKPANEEDVDAWMNLLSTMRRQTTIPAMKCEALGPALCWFPTGYRLLVPSRQWDALPSNERFAILRHELSHYRHGHIQRLAVARVLVLLHWFNPIAWICLRRIEQAYEWQADDDATKGDALQACHLANSLLAFAITKTSPRPAYITAHGSELRLRIQRLLHGGRTDATIASRCIFLTLVVILLAGSLVRVRTYADVKPESSSEILQSTSQKSTTDTIPVDPRLLAQEPPRQYRIDSGDELGYSPSIAGHQGVLSLPVDKKGNIELPNTKPLYVRGLTLEEAQELVRSNYSDNTKSPDGGKRRQSLTLIKERTYDITVTRDDLNSRSTVRYKLPAYQNDVLHALMVSGGMPSGMAEDQIRIVPSVSQSNYATSGSTVIVPIRSPSGQPISIPRENIVLKDFDRVIVAYKKPELRSLDLREIGELFFRLYKSNAKIGRENDKETVDLLSNSLSLHALWAMFGDRWDSTGASQLAKQRTIVLCAIESESSWYAPNGKVAYRFDVKLQNCVEDLLKTSSTIRMMNHNFEVILEGLRNDPMGPHIDLRRLLREHLGNNAWLVVDKLKPIADQLQPWLLMFEIKEKEPIEQMLLRIAASEPNGKMIQLPGGQFLRLTTYLSIAVHQGKLLLGSESELTRILSR
ncbi:MAG: M56 family metallopeptidase [Pirellula sp.]